MIDLRNQNLKKIANIKTKPEQIKTNNFHFALAEYIFRELKRKGIEVKKKNELSLRVQIGGADTHRYHTLVIDCLDGNIYAINKENKEKRVGRLMSFKGQRASDAYNCMKKSIEKIIKKINLYSLLDDFEMIEKKASINKVVLDLRNKK